MSLRFLKIWEKYQTAGHLVILKPWPAAGHLDSDKIYFRVVWIESRLQLRWFGRHCKFHLNFKSCTHQIEWIFVQESLEKIHIKFKELAEKSEKAWPSSRSDVTTVLCPDPYLRGRGPFRTRLQRVIKNRGFNQIKKFFRRNDHQSMKIWFSEKKF